MRFSVPLSPSLVKSLSQIDTFRGHWDSASRVPEERLEQLREAARIQAIGASCRLSGVHLSDFEVAGLLNDPTVSLPGALDVRNYAAAFDLTAPTARDLLEEENLAELHGVLVGNSGPSPWRTEAGHRETFTEDGISTGRVYPTLPPRLIEEKTAELLTWAEFEGRSGETHAVLVVAVFTLGYLKISPFERCNGRMARLLAGKLLRRCGYRFCRFGSIEREIEECRESVEEAFERSGAKFWTGEADLEPWVDSFVGLVARMSDRLRTKLELERDLLNFSPLQQSILHSIWEHGNVDAGLLLKLTGANRNTLKDNLRRLVDRGLLEKIGEKRGTRYRLANPE